jgi:ferredoxin
MRVRVDRDRCVSAGNCVMTSDAIFDQDDEGVVVVLDPDPSPERQSLVHEAVALCPASAISVDDER